MLLNYINDIFILEDLQCEVKMSDSIEKSKIDKLDKILQGKQDSSELIIGLVGAIGSDLRHVKDKLKTELKEKYGYDVHVIKMSDLIKDYCNSNSSQFKDELDQLTLGRLNNNKALMDCGDKIRDKKDENAYLAWLAIAKIANIRKEAKKSDVKKAYIIDSFKHQDEVKCFRIVYPLGFYLLGVFQSEEERKRNLNELSYSYKIDKSLEKLHSKTDEKMEGAIDIIHKIINNFSQNSRKDIENYATHFLNLYRSFLNDNNNQKLKQLEGDLNDYYNSLKAKDDCKRKEIGDSIRKRIKSEFVEELLKRDMCGHKKSGQQVLKTFQLSDFFLYMHDSMNQFKSDISRILRILFGSPFETPTFDEFAMFMAFSASLRSADLSRQVGAVIAKNKEILSTGANDIPKAGGGLYWPMRKGHHSGIVEQVENGRDYQLGYDSNKKEQQAIIETILSDFKDKINSANPSADESALETLRNVLQECRIKDLTEFGRVVHAEMEALLCCARNSVSTRGATLYCTTFPCHNCAKHIVAAGIERIIYVEPYPKSKAKEFHGDSVDFTGPNIEAFDNSKKVVFEPFVGIGPRRFFDLFSMSLGSGRQVKRKEKNGDKKGWDPKTAKLRLQMPDGSSEILEQHIISKLKPTNDSVLNGYYGLILL